MKRNFLLMVWIFVLGTMNPNSLKAQDKWDGETIATKFFAGTGTQSDPYIIRTGAECMYFLRQVDSGNTFEGKYICLGNDIILNMNCSTGTFAGNFDGNKHCISNAKSAFIAKLSGVIHDLKIEISSSTYGSGSLVGNNTGHIYNCYIYTSITSYSSGLAALAVSNNALIENCYATGRIHGNGEYGLGYNVAALVYDNRGTLQNCASEVSVSDYSGDNKSSQITYSNTGSIINCIQGKNDIATMFDVLGTTCKIEYVDTMRFVNMVSNTINKGQQIGNLPMPNYDCTFIGWYRNGELVKETDVVNNNWTLFAKWEQRIQQQPTKENMSIRVDDSQHATYKWYKLNSMPIFFADWKSTNHSSESSSFQTYTFENCKDYVLSFHYKVSSEQCCDKFTATLNGNILVNTGGEYSKDYLYVIPDNGQYTLRFSYSKDDSESVGKDMAEVSDIIVSPVPQLIANNVTSIQISQTTETVYYCNVTYSNSGVSLRSNFVQINQTPTSPTITFADANVKAICVANWDTNGDGELSEAEAKAVSDIGTVFKGNNNITSFDELQYFTGLTSIGASAFEGCSGLSSVTLPNNVTTIGYSAFSRCTGLSTVGFSNNMTTIGNNAFYGCTNLTSIIFPNHMTSIGDFAFSGCTQLVSISIPNSVTTIGQGAFYQTSWYNSQSNGLVYINNVAYQYKGTIPQNTAITIKTGTISISSNAFNGQIGLSSVSIPNSVTSIGDYAFQYCTGLTSLNIPNSVTSIGFCAYYECSNLNSIISEIEEPFILGSEAFSNISSTCKLTVPKGTKDAYISAGWTTSVFKGGIVESSSQIEQSLSLTSLPSMTYGASNYTLPAKTAQGLTLTWTSSNTSVATVSGNTLTVKGAGTATITATQAGNSNYKPFSKTFTLTVSKATLTVTANSYTIQQGSALPTYGVTFSGFKNGDTKSVLTKQPTITCSATTTSAPGSYSIKASGATAANYNFSYVNGTLTITEKPSQSMSLVSLPSMTYGAANYALPTQTTQGLTLTWASSNTSVATISGNTLTVKGAGTAAITASQAGNEEYKPFGKEFALTVAKAPLTITANNATKNVGEANPAFTASYEGFVKDEDATALTVQPTFTTEADEDSPVGTYDIVVSGAQAASYDITFVNGTLTVVDENALNNTLAVANVEVCKGSSVLLPVFMNNTESITALQFEVSLPDGVTISKCQLTDRKGDDHAASYRKLANGNYQVTVFSGSKAVFSGTEGTVLNLTLNVDENMVAGDYPISLKNIELTTAATKAINPADVTAKFTVSDVMIADVDGNGKVSITDAVAVVSHILGEDIDGFVAAAADVDGNGRITITDAVAIVDMILEGTASARSLIIVEEDILDPQ